MSSFADNFEAEQKKVAEAQRRANELERRFMESVSEKRLAEHRAGQAEDTVKKLEGEVTAANRRADVAHQAAERSQIHEQRANAAEDHAASLAAQVEKLTDKLAASQTALKDTRAELKELKELYTEGEARYAKAETLIAAWQQRLQADTVLTGAR